MTKTNDELMEAFETIANYCKPHGAGCKGCILNKSRSYDGNSLCDEIFVDEPEIMAYRLQQLLDATGK